MTGAPALRPPLWELPLWAAVAVWAFVPGSLTPIPTIGTIPVNSKHLVLLVLAFYLVLMRASLSEQPVRWPAWQFLMPLSFVALTAYAFASLLWANLPTRDAAGMVITLVLGLAAVAAAYAAVTLHSLDTLPGMLWRLSLALAVIGTVYTAESYFGLGLRGAEPFDFGIDRVRGPLFSASAGHLALLPALGMVVMVLVRSRFRNVLALTAAVAITFTTLGLGSRAAVAGIVLFVVLAARTVRGLRRRVTMAAGLAALVVVAGVILFARADPARLLSLQDDVRWSTHETGLAIVEDQPLVEKVVGGGLGSAWPWYLVDLERGGARNTGLYFIDTSYGTTLFHPHSVPLWAGVELGVPGLGLVLVICGFLLYHVTGKRADGHYAILAAALAASVTAFLFDHFLTRLFMLSTIWWVYVFGYLRLHARAAPSPPAPAAPVRAPEPARTPAHTGR